MNASSRPAQAPPLAARGRRPARRRRRRARTGRRGRRLTAEVELRLGADAHARRPRIRCPARATPSSSPTSAPRARPRRAPVEHRLQHPPDAGSWPPRGRCLSEHRLVDWSQPPVPPGWGLVRARPRTVARIRQTVEHSPAWPTWSCASPRSQQSMADAKGGGLATLDLTGPAGAAAVRGQGPGRRRPHRAGGRRDRARGRGPDRGARRTCSTPTRSRSTRPGRRCRTSGSARAATPSGAGWRCCAGSSTPAPTRPTARCRSSSRRCARCCSPRSRGWPTSSRSSWPRARRSSSRTSSPAGRARRTPASTWSRSAASSPSAAASSTSSRRPRSTRCAWSSSATRSTRSAPSPSPTSAPSSRSQRLWAPPCRELLLTDDVRRRAAELGAGPPAAARAHRQAGRGHGRRGDGVARPGARRRDGAARRAAPAGDPRARARPRAGPHPRPRPGRHQRGVPRRQLGRGRLGRAGADRPGRRHRCRASARSARQVLAQGQALVGDQPVRPRTDDDAEVDPHSPASRGRRPSPPRPTAATSSRPSPTSAPHLAAGRGSSPCTRATARRSGWSRCSASTTCPARLVERRGRRRADGVVQVTQGCLAHGLTPEPTPAW